jgi:hypothetical protein
MEEFNMFICVCISVLYHNYLHKFESLLLFMYANMEVLKMELKNVKTMVFVSISIPFICLYYFSTFYTQPTNYVY